MIRTEWFGTYNEAPEWRQFLKIIQGWDTGMISQPTRLLSLPDLWARVENTQMVPARGFRGRLDFPDLKPALLSGDQVDSFTQFVRQQLRDRPGIMTEYMPRWPRPRRREIRHEPLVMPAMGLSESVYRHFGIGGRLGRLL